MSTNQEWQVHDLALYPTYQLEDTEDVGLSVSLLIPLDAHNNNSGEFRLVLYGGDNDTVSIAAASVFPNLPPPIADTTLHFPCSSARTLIPDNSTACHWRGVETMIRYGTLNSAPCNTVQIIVKEYCFHGSGSGLIF